MSELADVIARRKALKVLTGDGDSFDPLADDDYADPYPAGHFYGKEPPPNPYAERKISLKRHIGSGLDPEQAGGVPPVERAKPVRLNPRSIKVLEDRGYTAEVVEWYDARRMRKHDFLGAVDVIAFKPGEPVLGVQLTTFEHMNERERKALALPRLVKWIQAGNRFVIHGWRRPDGASRNWILVEREVFAPIAPPMGRSSLWD